MTPARQLRVLFAALAVVVCAAVSLAGIRSSRQVLEADHVTLNRLAKEGSKRFEIICPGFSADCLETLEEIAVENRTRFIEAGGSELHYIPALNERDDHIAMMAELITGK